MTEAMGAGSARTSAPLSRFLRTPGGRFLGRILCVVVILGIALGIYLLGRAAANGDVKAAASQIQQLQNENQKLVRKNNSQTATITEQQNKLKTVQAKLDALMPTENTYNLSANQSLIVADGHLTIGLIGSPTNEGVNVNINGKPRMAAVGDIIDVAGDATTNCQIEVQSFDMFKAIIVATCTANKSK